MIKIFRVYDRENKTWIKNDAYIDSDGNLFILKKTLFGRQKMLTDENKYVYHKSIEKKDKNDVWIFEADICKSEKAGIVGVIAYIPENAAYCLLDYNNNLCYDLNIDSQEIEKIGNIFDNQELLPDKW